MVTFSRGGYLAFGLGLYAILFFGKKSLFVLLLLLTMAAFMFPVLLPGGIRYRMGQTFTNQSSYAEMQAVPYSEGSLESSANTRVEVWKGALKMIQAYPFFGIGYGLFQPMIRYYWSGEKPIDAHNTYLIIAAEMGIPALLLFLWIVLVAMLQTYLLYKNTSDEFTKAVALGFLGGLFGMLMSNMFGSRLDSQEVSGYFWILAALVFRLRILDYKEGVAAHRPVKIDARLRRQIDPAAEEPKAAPVRKSHKLDACWN
jgi:O-antigen ligase